MVDVEAGACGSCGSLSDTGNRNVCFQLDVDGVQKQRYCLGLFAIAVGADTLCSAFAAGTASTAGIVSTRLGRFSGAAERGHGMQSLGLHAMSSPVLH